MYALMIFPNDQLYKTDPYNTEAIEVLNKLPQHKEMSTIYIMLL